MLGIAYWSALVLAPLDRRPARRGDRAAAAAMALPARPSLRPPADLRPGADHRGPVPSLVRLVRPALRDPAALTGGSISASCSADLPRLGRRGVARALPRAPGSCIERTKLGAYLRAATENPTLVRAFGINVPRLITLTYGLGVALAALAGVLAAPIYRCQPADGRQPDHRGVRRRGDRRHGLDHGLDRHRLRARPASRA